MKFFVSLALILLHCQALANSPLQPALDCLENLRSFFIQTPVYGKKAYIPVSNEKFLVVTANGISSVDFTGLKMDGTPDLTSAYQAMVLFPGETKAVEIHYTNSPLTTSAFDERYSVSYVISNRKDLPTINAKEELTPETKKVVNDYIIHKLKFLYGRKDSLQYMSQGKNLSVQSCENVPNEEVQNLARNLRPQSPQGTTDTSSGSADQ